MKHFEDVPIPGLDMCVESRDGTPRPRRPYAADLEPTAETIKRFTKRVVPIPTGCHIWTGAVSGVDGYGRITFRRDGLSRTLSAHRFALLVAGLDAAGGVAEHRCNEPLCVRVDASHVMVSTQSANLRYAVACGRAGAHRAPLGERTRAERSRAVRCLVREGWDANEYAAIVGTHVGEPRLF